ncbi:MAG: Hsp33 family molecular chaperone HslO [Treponema sp.]|nr:Hsp33 family molecular chaperone HslO [Treponema sp.]
MNKAPITDNELIKHLDSIQKDGMSVFTIADGRYRGAFYNGTRMVNQMRANHNLGILETMILAQAELCAALLIPMMKGKEHITFKYDTNGPAAGFSVEADSSGYVRGHLLQNNIPIEKPLESWDLSPFFGDGTVTLSRLVEGAREPQSGTTEIKYRNIAKDLTWYFLQSEQTYTAFNTSVQFDKQGRVIGAGGMYLQAVPHTGGKRNKEAGIGNSAQTAESGKEQTDDEERLLTKVENAFKAIPSIGAWFAEGGDREDMIFGIFREFKPTVLVERDVIFDCPCSADKFAATIRTLGKKELDDIIAHDPEPIEVVCHNCGSIYKITKAMLQSVE